MRHAAIVLAAGKGSRMKSDIPKQYLKIDGKPVLYYSLKAFEDSFVDEIILVTGEGEQEYCRREILEKYQLKKVKQIIPGGKERYDSVYRGLCALKEADYVYIHDGARPFLSERILNRAKSTVEQYNACVAGMPVKDTIKIADESQFVKETPPRSSVWQIQTPQVFSYELVYGAYQKMYADNACAGITDDAMVVETMMGTKVKMFEASYQNIKITTPEDLQVAELFMKQI